MIRFFYISLSAGKQSFLESALDIIEEWDRRAKKHNIRVGVLLRFTNSNVKNGCLTCKLAMDRGLLIFIDNGAFSYLKSLDSRIDVWSLSRWLRDYSIFIKKYYEVINYFALPDVPVHGKMFVDKEERMRRIRLSAQLHLRFVKMIPRNSLPKAIPVIQGYSIEEYGESFRLLASNGILDMTAYTLGGSYRGVVAVGSICVRKPSSKGKTGLLAGGLASGTLDDFIPRLLNYNEIPVRGFHFFGLHREAVTKYGMHERFYASDSGAHGLNFKFKWKSFLKCYEPDERCYAKSVDYQLRVTLKPLISIPITNWFNY